MTYGLDRTLVPVTLVSADSQTISHEATLGALTLVGVIMPAAWTGAGNLQLQALVAEPSALPKVPVWADVVTDAGAALVIATAVAASVYIGIPHANQMSGFGRIKIKTTVAQLADRVITLVCIG